MMWVFGPPNLMILLIDKTMQVKLCLITEPYFCDIQISWIKFFNHGRGGTLPLSISIGLSQWCVLKLESFEFSIMVQNSPNWAIWDRQTCWALLDASSGVMLKPILDPFYIFWGVCYSHSSSLSLGWAIDQIGHDRPKVRNFWTDAFKVHSGLQKYWGFRSKNSKKFDLKHKNIWFRRIFDTWGFHSSLSYQRQRSRIF